MTEPFLTPERMKRIAAMPPAKRKIAMRLAAQREWDLCAADVLYWLDASQHIVPYVYTQDPKPVHLCTLCNDDVMWASFKRHIHLQNRHNIEARNDAELHNYFLDLPTIRPFPMKPYVKPIVEQWLREPLMVVEKSRDMVMTWTAIALFAWDVLYHEGRQHLFQSEEALKTRDLVMRVGIIYNNQPSWLRNIHKAYITEGITKAGLVKIPSLQSELIGLPKGAGKVRQYHPTGIYSDEAAFNPEAAETFAAIKPAIQAGGRYMAVSSANPSFFQRLCRDTVEEVV